MYNDAMNIQNKTKAKKAHYEITPDAIDFYYSDEARGIRLQVDYEKAEVRIKEAEIEHTIVVFGSARIKPSEETLEEIKAIEKALESNAGNDLLLSQLERAKKALHRSLYYEEARKFGQLVGTSGRGPDDCKVTLMTGGGPGIMEAANRGAHDVGAKSIGLNIKLPHEQHPNPYITPELSFNFHYFGIRKLHFMQRAKALVVFPGGYGTLDELFDILTLIQTGKSPHIPIVLVSKYHWDNVLNFDFLVEEGVISPDDKELFSYAESAEEAWEQILEWYEKRGNPLFSHTSV
jgi:uncharacterized protein (TIGR00730 family)